MKRKKRAWTLDIFKGRMRKRRNWRVTMVNMLFQQNLYRIGVRGLLRYSVRYLVVESLRQKVSGSLRETDQNAEMDKTRRRAKSEANDIIQYKFSLKL